MEHQPHEAHLQTYARVDGLFGWRLLASNGEIIAVDGGQGFRDRHDALRSFDGVLRLIDNRSEQLRVEHE